MSVPTAIPIFSPASGPTRYRCRPRLNNRLAPEDGLKLAIAGAGADVRHWFPHYRASSRFCRLPRALVVSFQQVVHPVLSEEAGVAKLQHLLGGPDERSS